VAIVTVPGLVSSRGKVGTSVFYNNGSRKNVRSYCKHTKTSTPSQRSQRAFFTEAKDAWKALSWAMVLQWNVWANQVFWKKGAYQYFIHCYMRGIGPMPVDYSHLILKRQVTVAEVCSLGSGDLELIPSPGPGKFLRMRMIQLYCYSPNFSVTPLKLKYSSYVFLANINCAPSFLSAYSQLGFDSNYATAFFDVDNMPIVLSSDFQAVTDLGGSSDLFLQIEYSIFDWYNS
jgi:hypothetical protein